MAKKKTMDGWTNVNKGIGSEKDVTTNTYFTSLGYKTQSRIELNALYTKNWIATKVVNIPVEDALKDERDIQIEDAELKEQFLKGLEGFRVDEKISQLCRWSKVFGSAVLIIVSSDDTMDKPLQIDKIPQGGLSNIVVLDRFDVFATELERNPLSSRYLEPNYYTLSKGAGKIHHSRVIKLDGVATTNYDKELLQGFGVSIYENIYQTIMNASMSPDLLINLLTQSNIDVFKINGLNQAISDGEDDLATKRINVANMHKSLMNGIALDGLDSYENISKNFGGLSEVNKEFYQIVAGAADIPYSRFMGATLGGLNPTGEGELKNYYNKIIAEQRRLFAIYDLIDKILQRHLFGFIIDDYKWEFPSLFQMSDEQRSIIDNRDAQTKAIYLDKNIITEMEAKAGLVDSRMFPTITAESFEEERELFEEMETLEPTEEPIEGEEV